ncbi:MAG TPA: ABC transporter permease [Propionibacteriaceae bacterium]|nr:ABC transporter permease [Propionibacteriaceae bacterium]
MIWVAWRQFRAQAVTAAIGLVMLGIWLLATGRGLADEYASGLAQCSGGGCNQFMDGFVDQHQASILSLTLVVLVVPALLGLFWGAPLVARELDAGTHRLAWNQSVTRFRWLTMKLVLIGVSCAVVAGLVVWWVDRWSTPLDAASQLDPRLPMGMAFASRGVVPLAYAVFAFALGVTAGMLTKRVLPAMAVTLAIFLAAQFSVGLLVRPHLAPTHTSAAPVTSATMQNFNFGPDGIRLSGDAPVPGAWLLSNYMVDASGNRVDVLPRSLIDAPECTPSINKDISPCLEMIAAKGYRQVSTYHLPSQFWQLQWTEAGLYAAATAGLVTFCFWWLRRRVV